MAATQPRSARAFRRSAGTHAWTTAVAGWPWTAGVGATRETSEPRRARSACSDGLTLARAEMSSSMDPSERTWTTSLDADAGSPPWAFNASARSAAWATMLGIFGDRVTDAGGADAAATPAPGLVEPGAGEPAPPIAGAPPEPVDPSPPDIAGPPRDAEPPAAVVADSLAADELVS